MKLLIDDLNYFDIKDILDHYPIAGVTCNPAILAKSGEKPYEILKKIRRLIGEESDLHVQVVSTDYEEMKLEAKRIVKELGDSTYIKVPVNKVGLKFIKYLSKENYNITATAVYTPLQGILAAQAGAHFVAPYYNRIENMGYDALETVLQMNQSFMLQGLETEILGASFKNSKQVLDLLSNGIYSVTVTPAMFDGFIASESIEGAVNDFTNIFEDVYGKDANMHNCE